MMYGAGSIEPHRGKYRLRAFVEGKRKTIACGTLEEVESAQRGFAALKAQGAVAIVSKPSLQSFGPTWLDRRELAGLRDVANDRSRWKHVEGAQFYDLAMVDIRRADVRRWLDELGRKKPGARHKAKRLSSATIRHTLKLLRGCLEAAVAEELLAVNPAAGFKVPKRAEEEHVWTWLPPEEQKALLEAVPAPERWLVAVALGTGVRQSELYRMPLTDVHLDAEVPFVIVRYSRKGKTTKNAKVRRVPLFGMALDGMRRWLAFLPSWAKKNPHGLAFPTKRGCRRQESKAPRGWASWLKAGGLDRPEARHDGRAVRWHDLRHTCASSLVAGWWGRAWRLEEVRDLLGHSSVTVTERYAHLAPSVLADAARGTSGRSAGIAPTTAPKPAAPVMRIALFSGGAPRKIRTCDLRLRSAPHNTIDSPDLAAPGGNVGADLEALAVRQLRAVASRNRFAVRYSVELANAVLDASERAAAKEEAHAAG